MHQTHQASAALRNFVQITIISVYAAIISLIQLPSQTKATNHLLYHTNSLTNTGLSELAYKGC